MGLCRFSTFSGPSPLYLSIEQRVQIQGMLARGWPEELDDEKKDEKAKQLLARGIPATAKPFELIGYRELRAHLAGQMSPTEPDEADAQPLPRQGWRRGALAERTGG